MKVRKAVIPVAGFGTRFLPATKATPKEMFPLVDKPVAQYAVEEAAAAGIEEVIFVTGQAKRAIEDHFDRNFELEYLLEHKGKTDQLAEIRAVSELVQFVYVRQKEMKGLGHAILQARRLIDDEPFAILLPDDVYTGKSPAIKQLIDAYGKHRAPIVGMREVSEELVSRYGIIAGEPAGSDVKITDFVEKPERAAAPSRNAAMGRYVMEPRIFDYLQDLAPGAGGEIQFTDAIRDYVKENEVYGVPLTATHHDAGEKLGYLKAFVDIGLARKDLGDEFRRYLKGLLDE